MASVEWLSVFVFVIFGSSLGHGSEIDVGNGLMLEINGAGLYNLHVNSRLWLKNAPTFFTVGGKQYSTSDGSLKLNRTGTETGSDNIGEWRETAMYYIPVGLDITFKTSLKVYDGLSAVFFGQHFHEDVKNVSVGDKNDISSGFPSFVVEEPQDSTLHWHSAKSHAVPELGFVAFGGLMFGNTRMSMGRWSNSTIGAVDSGLDSGPLVLFQEDGMTMIVTPFDNFMSSSAVYKRRYNAMTASWGMMGLVDEIPAHTSMWTVAYVSPNGINRAFEEWGEIMRVQYDRHTEFRDSDLTNNYIGYYTDNGAYYYYITEPSKNYEETLLEVMSYSNSLNIPYRYIQYDSWFYFKGPRDGVTEWVAMPSIFPNGLANLWNKTGLPVVAHNRWWSDKTVYAKQNGGPYDFIVETDTHHAIPTQQKFWDDLMLESAKWGLIVYEQDWLNDEFDNMHATVSQLGLGRQWLRQMGAGAAKAGLTIQYCMALSRHALQSLEIPVVSQARASDDYQPGNNQWKLGISSMFAHALGVAPFKDNFWTTSVQPGNKYNKSEPYPSLQSVVATLSTGPVGPSDKIGHADAALIMRSCNSDGLILKPSKPATAVNKQIIQSVFGTFTGQVWSTYSLIGRHRFGIIMAADMGPSETFTLTPEEAGLEDRDPLAMFNWFDPSSSLTEFSSHHPLKLHGCDKSHFCLYMTLPTLHTMGKTVFLLGELDKWVPMSSKRVTGISVDSHDIRLTLTGGVQEKVNFSYVVDSKKQTITCVINEAGVGKLSIVRGECY